MGLGPIELLLEVLQVRPDRDVLLPGRELIVDVIPRWRDMVKEEAGHGELLDRAPPRRAPSPSQVDVVPELRELRQGHALPGGDVDRLPRLVLGRADSARLARSLVQEGREFDVRPGQRPRRSLCLELRLCGEGYPLPTGQQGVVALAHCLYSFDSSLPLILSGWDKLFMVWVHKGGLTTDARLQRLEVAEVSSTPYKLRNQLFPLQTKFLSKHQTSTIFALASRRRPQLRTNALLLQPFHEAAQVMTLRHGHGHHVGVNLRVPEHAPERQHGRLPVVRQNGRQIRMLDVGKVTRSEGQYQLGRVFREPLREELAQHVRQRAHGVPNLLVTRPPRVSLVVQSDEIVLVGIVHD
mmetsp:Transcript_4/g.8  ORF Transcript_4/g.8 Transcript_4/m.8 type:complete len:353 (-) Transcript_4:455-1513(-)